MSEPIPQPRAYPFLGNALDVDGTNSTASFTHLAKIYGQFYKVSLGGKDIYVVTGYELLNEICDEKRFRKALSPSLVELRALVHDGLFTSETHEHNWGVAHRTLLPSFGPLRIRDMFDEMHEISTQLIMKWARFGLNHAIDPTDDFTRLTLDTIGLCAMETRFNSFYHDEMHPFPLAMARVLAESGRRSARPAVIKPFYAGSERQYFADLEYMKAFAMSIVQDKTKNPSEKRNIVNAMLNGKDPKTGEKMTAQSIADNMITFLIAGHETTSGLLSFVCYRLCANLDVQRKAQAEVDEVVGHGPIKLEHVGKLHYIVAILREAIRLNPPASGIAFSPNAEAPEMVTIGGKYSIPKNNCVLRCILGAIMQDPTVWGDDAADFRPERCLDENFSKLPPNAWKPFGNGVRSCIGREFSWQESIMCIALILQNFDLKLADTSYKLRIKQTLTLKPDGFRMHAVPRPHVDIDHLEAKITGGAAVTKPAKETSANTPQNTLIPMTVFWGGNSGTSESLAHVIEMQAAAHGFEVSIKELDDAADRLPADQPVVIITASYEGEPPDNARNFVTYLKGVSDLKGVSYAVFGNGNHDWTNTYQRVPTLCDDLMKAAGATRLVERGSADAASDDIFDKFEAWQAEKLWPALQAKFGGFSTGQINHPTGLDAEVYTTTRSSHLKQHVQEAVIVSNEPMGGGTDAKKRHVEIQLPTELSYRAGDYLGILPINPRETVHRAMIQFQLPWDAKIKINDTKSQLPNTTMSVFELLAAYVELSQPATRRNIALLASTAHEESERTALEAFSDDKTFSAEITKKRVSILDLLQQYPSISITFQEYLSMLPQLHLRQYSISSSPLATPGRCSLTIGVLDQPALADHSKHFHGVASTYLSRLQPGDHLLVNVMNSHASFHLPKDAETTPIIMAAAGTGVAPFRAFIQERHTLITQGGKTLAPALLFLGCQDDADVPYAQEFAQWEHSGAVEGVMYAFSRKPEASDGCKYVQDRFWKERKRVTELYRGGAKVYVCGHGRVGEGLKWKAIDTYKENNKGGISKEDVDSWFAGLRNERWMADVFD